MEDEGVSEFEVDSPTPQLPPKPFVMEDDGVSEVDSPTPQLPSKPFVMEDEGVSEVTSLDPRQPLVMGANGGAVYVRWGQRDCPYGRELVYRGRAGGSHFTHSGGGSNYQCLPFNPQNFDFGPGTVAASFMYGAEYEMFGNVPKSSLHLHDHDVPCAVCYVATRATVLMIPAKYTCPPKWTREYYGYLMAERFNHHRSTFECVDVNAQVAVGGHLNHNGALFYHVEPRVGSLPGPPYDNQKELTCAVCTR